MENWAGNPKQRAMKNDCEQQALSTGSRSGGGHERGVLHQIALMRIRRINSTGRRSVVRNSISLRILS
jgi:hypothetical protein